MVSFKLGKEIEKDILSSCHERGTQKKKIDIVDPSGLQDGCHT